MLEKIGEVLLRVETFGWVASLAMGVALAGFVRVILDAPPLPATLGGIRGIKRARALSSPGFATLEPLLRQAGGALKGLLAALGRVKRIRHWIERLEQALRQQLIWAGEPAGLDHHELMALSLVCAGFGGGLGVLAGWSEGSMVWVGPGALVGLFVPQLRIQSLATARFVEATRQLPAIIDLTALSMSAGSDLPSALRRVIAGRGGVVAEELHYLLHSLDLGITRRAALLAFRERLSVAEVRDFVRAILLAEKKGTSIAEALSQQAQVGRERRTVRAEEAAARASVLLLVPLMLLMGTVLLMVMGPLVIAQAGLN